MKLFFKNYLCIFLLFSNIAHSQLLNDKDTTLIRGGYKLHFHRLTFAEDSALLYLLDDSAQSLNNQFAYSHIMRNKDSIINLLKPYVTFHYNYYQWDTTFFYCDKIVCRNGMNLILKDGVNIQRYYPDKDIIVSNEYIFNLKSGENDYEIEFNNPISRKIRIVGVRYGDENNEEIELLLQERRNKNYITLFNFQEIKDSPYLRQSYHVMNKKIYLSLYDEWWEISIKRVQSVKKK